MGLCFLDRNLRYISLNKRFTEAHGKPIDSYLGRSVAEVIPEYYSEVEPYLRRALQGEAISALEVSRADPASPDQMKTYLVTYQPARDEMDEVIGISCVAVEITERKTGGECPSREHRSLLAGGWDEPADCLDGRPERQHPGHQPALGDSYRDAV